VGASRDGGTVGTEVERLRRLGAGPVGTPSAETGQGRFDEPGTSNLGLRDLRVATKSKEEEGGDERLREFGPSTALGH